MITLTISLGIRLLIHFGLIALIGGTALLCVILSVKSKQKARRRARLNELYGYDNSDDDISHYYHKQQQTQNQIVRDMNTQLQFQDQMRRDMEVQRNYMQQDMETHQHFMDDIQQQQFDDFSEQCVTSQDDGGFMPPQDDGGSFMSPF